MRQQFFEEQQAPRWRELAEILDGLDARAAVDTTEFPRLYRRLCQDLALARDRQFGGQLIDRLNGAVLQPPPSHDASRREIIATPLTPEEEQAEAEDDERAGG